MTSGTTDTLASGGAISAHLRHLGEEAVRKGSLSVAEMIETIGMSSTAFAILIPALPALTPIPGPFGMVFGSCLALVSLQILAGVRHLRLPGIVGRRRMSADTAALVLRHTAPVIALIILAIAPLESDGLVAIAGLAASAVALGITVGLIHGIVSASTWVTGP